MEIKLLKVSTEYNGTHKDFTDTEELFEYLNDLDDNNEYLAEFYEDGLQLLAEKSIGMGCRLDVQPMSSEGGDDLTIHYEYFQQKSYHITPRNGYWGVDEYLNESGENDSPPLRCFEYFKTKKLANSVCRELNGLASEMNELKYQIEIA